MTPRYLSDTLYPAGKVPAKSGNYGRAEDKNKSKNYKVGQFIEDDFEIFRQWAQTQQTAFGTADAQLEFPNRFNKNQIGLLCRAMVKRGVLERIQPKRLNDPVKWRAR